MTITLLWLMLSQGALAANCGTSPELDCDGDNWTQGNGDCDDDEPLVNPGLSESCDDDLDNNCDNLFNEGCDVQARQGELGGGGSCTGGSGVGGVSALVLPLFLLRRRRGGEA